MLMVCLEMMKCSIRKTLGKDLSAIAAISQGSASAEELEGLITLHGGFLQSLANTSSNLAKEGLRCARRYSKG